MEQRDGHLSRIFWMSPNQRLLYKQYRDVLFNDNTYKNNTFSMPLNQSVVIDCHGKTRIVAVALMEHETKEDFIWLLQMLLEAGDNLPPKAVLVDQDAAMESALNTVLPEMFVANCTWHLKNNLAKASSGFCLRDEIIDLFHQAKNQTTAAGFENTWKELMDVYRRGWKATVSSTNQSKRTEEDLNELIDDLMDDGDDSEDELEDEGDSGDDDVDPDDSSNAGSSKGGSSKGGSSDDGDVGPVKGKLDGKTIVLKPTLLRHLNKLYSRRKRWAKAWVGLHFTAGAEATQRVEKCHHLVKKKLNTASALEKVLRAVDCKETKEAKTQKFKEYKDADGNKILSRDMIERAEHEFDDVQRQNDKYLAGYVVSQMRREMGCALLHTVTPDPEV